MRVDHMSLHVQLEWGPTTSVPAPIQQLMGRLQAQAGIESVVLSRSATDRRHVSQELQVWAVGP